MSSFKNSVVLITGGASGIGRLLALYAGARGSDVVIWDINEPGMEKVAEEIRSEGSNADFYKCDVSDREEVYSAAQKVLERYGGVDILINNAGVVTGKPFMESPDENILRSFGINVFSAFWTTKAFLPVMKKRNKGHIVNVSSAAGLIGVPKLADYSAGKFAVFGFNESLRTELKKEKLDIKTTIVCPYYIDTGMFAGVKTRFSFILPILKPAKVASKIIKAIENNKTSLYMPPIVSTVPPLRLLPDSVFDKIASVLGIHDTMNDFKGRQKEEKNG